MVNILKAEVKNSSFSSSNPKGLKINFYPNGPKQLNISGMILNCLDTKIVDLWRLNIWFNCIVTCNRKEVTEAHFLSVYLFKFIDYFFQK